MFLAVRLNGEKIDGKCFRTKTAQDEEYIDVEELPKNTPEPNVDTTFSLPSLSPPAPSTSNVIPSTPKASAFVTPPGTLYRLVNNIFDEVNQF